MEGSEPGPLTFSEAAEEHSIGRGLALRLLSLGVDSGDLDVFCLEALGAFLHFELDVLAFVQAAKSRALDFGVMDEHVALAICTADKAKALRVVEPFYCYLFHNICSLST